MTDKLNPFVSAVEKSIAEQNWYAALIVAITLPDMCGYLETGRASPKAYIDWFNRFVANKYISTTCVEPFAYLTGDDCYALRCALLHQASHDIRDQAAQKVLSDFRFRYPMAEGRFHRIYCGFTSGRQSLALQVDIFCKDICDGVRDWATATSFPSTVPQDRLDNMLEIQPLHTSF